MVVINGRNVHVPIDPSLFECVTLTAPQDRMTCQD